MLQTKGSKWYLFIVVWLLFSTEKGWRKNVLAQHVCVSYLPWSCLLSLSNYLCSDFGIIHCIQVQVAWLFWLALWSIGGLFFCNLLGRVLRKNQRLGWGRGFSGFTSTRCMWFRGIQLGILKVDLSCSIRDNVREFKGHGISSYCPNMRLPRTHWLFCIGRDL